MEEDGCCGVYESCSGHYGEFIGVVIVLILAVGISTIGVISCIRRYLEEKRMRKQHKREAWNVKDLDLEERTSENLDEKAPKDDSDLVVN